MKLYFYQRLVHRIYFNKRRGAYLFLAESFGRRLLEGGRYWRAAIISTSACTRDSREFSSTGTYTGIRKEVTLVDVQCSQLVCVIDYYSFIDFQFFVILTVNKWIVVVFVQCQ